MAAADVGPQLSIPSRYRVEPGSCDIPLGVLPQTCSTTPEDPDSVATPLIEKLNDSITKKDSASLAALFLENSYWRDHLCLSWDFRTLKGREVLAKFTVESASSIKIEIDRSAPFKAPHTGPIDAFGEVYGIEFNIKVTTTVGKGQGVVRLAQEGNDWKIFTVFTTLVELTGHEEGIGARRPIGVQHGAHQGRKNWQDRRNADANFEGKDPVVLIVGMYFTGDGISGNKDLELSKIFRCGPRRSYCRCASEDAERGYIGNRPRGSHRR